MPNLNIQQLLLSLLPEYMRVKIQNSANTTFLLGLQIVYQGYRQRHGIEVANEYSAQLVKIAKYEDPKSDDLFYKAADISKKISQFSMVIAAASFRNGGIVTPIIFSGVAWATIVPTIINKNQLRESVIKEYSPTLTWSAKAKDVVNGIVLTKREDELPESNVIQQLTALAHGIS